ncbi:MULTISPECIES: hypothetical protein, partial [unclassified Pseudomonas]
FSSTPIQVGGVAMPGTPAAPVFPNPVEPLVAIALRPQAQALKIAAQSAQPICAICEKAQDPQT